MSRTVEWAQFRAQSLWSPSNESSGVAVVPTSGVAENALDALFPCDTHDAQPLRTCLVLHTNGIPPGTKFKAFVLDRVRSFGLVVAIGFLLMVSLAVTAALNGWLARSDLCV